ncbi:unnamed protein product [Prunus armeniaca]|uniref:Uncharacterized protein n=1 Tax=Prunus armeniaca TaxID=36596 RepID=A0A6J5X284_PRUAR|nr:unnamed protein product [Prunus armeniaca]
MRDGDKEVAEVSRERGKTTIERCGSFEGKQRLLDIKRLDLEGVRIGIRSGRPLSVKRGK